MGGLETRINLLRARLAAVHGPVHRLLSPPADPDSDSTVWLVEDKKDRMLRDDKVVPISRLKRFNSDPRHNRDLLLGVQYHPDIPKQWTPFYLTLDGASTHDVWPGTHMPATLSLREGPKQLVIEPDSVLPYMIECAELAIHLHERTQGLPGVRANGVIHCDFKPSNALAHVKIRTRGWWSAVKTDEAALALPEGTPVWIHRPVFIDYESARSPGDEIDAWSEGYSHPVLAQRSRAREAGDPVLSWWSTDVYGLGKTGLSLAMRTGRRRDYPWADVAALVERCLDGEQYTKHITMRDLLRVLTRRRTIKRTYFAGAALVGLSLCANHMHNRAVAYSGTPLLEQFSGSEAEQEQLFSLMARRIAEDAYRKYPLPETGVAPGILSEKAIVPLSFKYDFGGAATRTLLLASKKEPELFPLVVRYALAQIKAQQEGFGAGEGHNLYVLPLAELSEIMGTREIDGLTSKILREAVWNAAEHVRSYIAEHPSFGFYPYERPTRGDKNPNKMDARDSRSVYQTLLPASELFHGIEKGQSDPFLDAAVIECLALRKLWHNGVMLSDVALDSTAQSLEPRPRSLGRAQYAKALYTTMELIERRQVQKYAALVPGFREDVRRLLQPFLSGDPGYYLDDASPRYPWDSESAALAFDVAKKMGLDTRSLLTQLVAYVPRGRVTAYVYPVRDNIAVLTHMCHDARDDRDYWCSDEKPGTLIAAEPWLAGLSNSSR